mmetsp:Transcript_25818/g.59553  ORF Transcript_25818/g.59553 Transcript_25818/m.59553 type:complete len:242 (-) Transcript_25818:1933-2658(-)
MLPAQRHAVVVRRVRPDEAVDSDNTALAAVHARSQRDRQRVGRALHRAALRHSLGHPARRLHNPRDENSPSAPGARDHRAVALRDCLHLGGHSLPRPRRAQLPGQHGVSPHCQLLLSGDGENQPAGDLGPHALAPKHGGAAPGHSKAARVRREASSEPRHGYSAPGRHDPARLKHERDACHPAVTRRSLGRVCCDPRPHHTQRGQPLASQVHAPGGLDVEGVVPPVTYDVWGGRCLRVVHD